MPLVMDKYGNALRLAYMSLEIAAGEDKLKINRHYMTTDSVSINFHLNNKRYLLVVNVSNMGVEVWHSSGKHLVKRKFTHAQIVNREFVL